MDVDETKPAVPEKPIAALAARAASLVALPALGAICYGAPYITGLVYRQVYLRGFNVPETFFKSDASDYFVYAYEAFLEIHQTWSSFVFSPAVWLSMIALVTLLGLEVLFLYWFSNSSVSTSIAKSVGRNKYIALATGLVSFSTAITTLLLLIPVLIFPLIILPAIVGTYGANRSLERDIAVYDKGCDQQTAVKNQCHVIMDGPRIVATGFLVTASDTRLVIYEDHKAKILPIKDYSIEALPPKDYLALIATRKIFRGGDVNVVQP